MAPLKVLIVGGGITGPSLAFWLARLDCHVTIVERSPDLRASGQQIDLRGEGVTVMRRMGLESAVRAKVVDEPGLRVVDQQGKVKATFGSNKSGKGKQSFTSEFEIMRGDLVRILYDATKDRCKYLFGMTVDDFEQHGNSVHVRFSNGEEDDFDLMVGADGQGSRTRRRLLGPDAKDPFNFLNVYLCYFTIPQSEMDSRLASVCVLPRRRVMATRMDNPETLQVYLGVLDPNREMKELEQATKKGDVKTQKAIYAQLFKDAGWEAPRLIRNMLNSPQAEDFYGQQLGQVKMDRWAKGRVVLLGDAAYCASPMSGLGTSIGLLGAYMLAGEISKQLASQADQGAAVDAALGSYETAFRPLIKKAQSLPPGIPAIVYPETEWGVWLLQFVIGLFAKLRIGWLVERFSTDNFGGSWKLPDYPGLRYESPNSSS